MSIPPYPFHSLPLSPHLGGGKGMEWKRIFCNILPFLYLRVLIEEMRSPFPCLRVEGGGNRLVLF